MGKKLIEQWMTDVFPGLENIESRYSSLTHRELAIVAAGSLDLALAEVLAKRLLDYPEERNAFLGIGGNGSGPCSSLSARTQLALLVGLIQPKDASVLDAMRNIRNLFAHKVNVTFTTPEVRKHLLVLLDTLSGHILEGDRLEPIKAMIATDEEAGAIALMTAFCVYQAYFYTLSHSIERCTRNTVDPTQAPGLSSARTPPTSQDGK